jgi:hypothetical protein
VSDRLHQTATIAHDEVYSDSVREAVGDVLLKLEEGAERRNLALDWNSLTLTVTQERTNGLYLPTDAPLGHYIDAAVDVLS